MARTLLLDLLPACRHLHRNCQYAWSLLRANSSWAGGKDVASVATFGQPAAARPDAVGVPQQRQGAGESAGGKQRRHRRPQQLLAPSTAGNAAPSPQHRLHASARSTAHSSRRTAPAAASPDEPVKSIYGPNAASDGGHVHTRAHSASRQRTGATPPRVSAVSPPSARLVTARPTAVRKPPQPASTAARPPPAHHFTRNQDLARLAARLRPATTTCTPNPTQHPSTHPSQSPQATSTHALHPPLVKVPPWHTYPPLQQQQPSSHATLLWLLSTYVRTFGLRHSWLESQVRACACCKLT